MLTRRDSYKQTDAKFALLGARNVGKSGKLIVLISYSVRYTAQKLHGTVKVNRVLTRSIWPLIAQSPFSCSAFPYGARAPLLDHAVSRTRRGWLTFGDFGFRKKHFFYSQIDKLSCTKITIVYIDKKISIKLHNVWLDGYRCRFITWTIFWAFYTMYLKTERSFWICEVRKGYSVSFFALFRLRTAVVRTEFSTDMVFKWFRIQRPISSLLSSILSPVLYKIVSPFLTILSWFIWSIH